MERMKISARWGLVIIVALLGVPMMASAHGGDPTKIHSCVNNNSGEVKIVGPNDTCLNNWTPVDWNITGPAGPAGPTGATGATGPQGPAGADAPPPRTQPLIFPVNCGDGQTTIQGALKGNLIPGDTLLVSGYCNENVDISSTAVNRDISGITLDGQGSATINGPDTTTKPTVRITARGITIRGFSITGGQNGIGVLRGGTATISSNLIDGAAGAGNGIILTMGGVATIDGNTVQNAKRAGIGLGENSSARITNNMIQSNRDGISVTESSSAHIGFSTFSDTAAAPNTIQGNSRNGIVVARSSTAAIVSNTISDNLLDGVGVNASHADIGANLINGNGQNGINGIGQNGINLGENAVVKLGQTGLVFDGPNTTTVNNVGWGLRCFSGGEFRSGTGIPPIGGGLGSLNGNLGAKLNLGCQDLT